MASTEMVNPARVRRSLELSKQAGWPSRGSKKLADIDIQLDQEFPIRKNIMGNGNKNYSGAIGPSQPYEFNRLFPKTALDMPKTNTFGVNLGGHKKASKY